MATTEITSNLDRGLCPGNYFDYEDDETAVAQENEIAEEVAKSWDDPTFPHDGRSLYFDPLNPPKGTVEEHEMRWCSISLGEIAKCDNPLILKDDQKSALIEQGALGNNYFVNALRLIASNISYLKRLIVSTRKSNKGIYTFKFCKAGKWRYVHIDDKIPCRYSGIPNFCRNLNPNETFAMLIEKAYAKLHGCYESIAFGLVDKALMDMCYGASVRTLRSEKFEYETAKDDIFEEIELGMNENRLIGCMRKVPDPYSEDMADRKGVAMAHMYQIIDARIVVNPPTEELDELESKMICVRNLTEASGRWNGRWSYGDFAWAMYPAIAEKLTFRTREILRRRGLEEFDAVAAQRAAKPKGAVGGPTKINGNNHASSENDLGTSSMKQEMIGREGTGDGNDEPDSLALDYASRMGNSMIKNQPRAADLHWIQVDDFVEVFNRSFIIDDCFMNPNPALTIFDSQWQPGETVTGSGGQPTIEYSPVPPEKEENDEEEETKDEDDGGLDATSSKLSEGVDGKSKDKVGDHDDDDDSLNGDPVVDPDRRIINPDFTDNPMFPFSANEPCVLRVTLLQADRRWSVGRLGDEPRDTSAISFMTRNDRLGSCMKYEVGLGFLVGKLSGMKMQITTFKLKKLAACCHGLEWSSGVTAALRIPRAGRYALIPYTDVKMEKALDYRLLCAYKDGSIDFEVKDIIKEKFSLIDEVMSEEEDEDDEEMDEAALEAALDGEERSDAGMSLNLDGIVAPNELPIENWEWTEDSEEYGIRGLYSEVGVVARDIATLRTQVNRMQSALKSVMTEQARVAAEKAVLEGDVTARLAGGNRPGSRGRR